jgi:hypothetical protein
MVVLLALGCASGGAGKAHYGFGQDHGAGLASASDGPAALDQVVDNARGRAAVRQAKRFGKGIHGGGASVLVLMPDEGVICPSL